MKKTRAVARGEQLTFYVAWIYKTHEPPRHRANFARVDIIYMTATIARLIGGAGTGKTTELLRIMSLVIEGGIQPHDIGFVSFTRAARSEAATRAADKFGCKVDELQRSGWFRTLHSVCYRCLGAGDDLIIEDKKESREWLENALQAPVSYGEASEDDLGIVGAPPKSDAAVALAIWHAARNRLEPYDTVWNEARLRSDTIPPLSRAREWVERYELHKTIDHRRDFTDMLGQFAGWLFRLDGHDRTAPQGETPDLPVWFFDEQQDTSRLLDSVCHRLIDTPSCRWVYVVGDFFQAIYSFAGADPTCFLKWPAAKEGTMPKSYRCPRPIHELGERILRKCSDYFDRQIAPADHEGQVESIYSIHEILDLIDPREQWLLLARTNFQAARITNLLNKAGTPWRPSKGHGGWESPKRNAALDALMALQGGFPITPDEWRAAIQYLPSKYCDEELLTRGTKTRWAADDFHPAEELGDMITLGGWGATPRLKEMIGQGTWLCLIDKASLYVSAVQKHGHAATQQSGIRVGTVHSVKGAEADNVVLLTTTSTPIARAFDTPSGADEERRVAYVGVTRAKRRLVIVNEPKERNRMEIDV